MKIGTRSFQEPNSIGYFKPLKQVNQPQAQAVANYMTPFARLFSAQSLLGIRGMSKEQRTQTFSQTLLQTAQVGLSSIPMVGPWLAFGLRALVGTGEGQRAVKAVGRTVEQGYQAQKSLFRGDVLGAVRAFEGGSSHKQRQATFFGAVTSRIQELQTKGGTLTAQDVAGFKQAIAYGDVKPLGTDVDLTKIDLKVGTNPFAGPAEIRTPEFSQLSVLSRSVLR
jgi:hypothetical protein